MQFKFRSHHDHRATRIVAALAKQVLPEATLLTLKHISERLQRPLVGAGDDAAAAAVVKQGVHGLLQHALFIAHDDIRRAQLQQPLEAVITINDATIEIVKIGGRKATAVEWHQRAQLRRDYRHHLKNHPLWTIARLDEGLYELEALDELLALGLGAGLGQVLAQRHTLFFQVDRNQHVANGLGTDARLESIIAIFVEIFEIGVLGDQLILLERRQARFGHNVILKIENPLDLFESHIE